MSSRVLCVNLRSRRRVRCTRLVSVVRMSRAASPRPQYSTRTILPNILLSSSRRQKLAHRSSHRFSSQLSGRRTRTCIAGSKKPQNLCISHMSGKMWPGPALGGPPRYRFYVLRVTGPFMHLYNVLNNLTLAARDRRVRNNPQFARFHLW